MKKILIALPFAIAAATASAQDNPFYVGAHYGQSKLDSTCDGVSGSGVSCDNTGNAFKLLGGYRFHPNLSMELAYNDFGEAKASGPGGTATVKGTAFDLSFVGAWQPIERLSLYGRLGLYRASTEVKINTITLVDSSSETNTGFMYGLGVGYDITPRVTVRAEWQKYDGVGGGSIGEDDITVISLGVLFRF